MKVELQLPDGVELVLYEEFERRIRRGEISAETPVRLDVVTGAAFVPVGELELFQTLADPEEAIWWAQLRRGAPLMTAALIGVQLRVYLWAKTPGTADYLVDHFTNWAPAVLEAGEVHRLLSYGFLHLGLSHLTLNMLFLAYAGWNLERAMGRRNLLAVFLFSVVTGGLLSMLMSPSRPSLGASGGDFGLIAASVVFGWKFEDRLPPFARKYFGWAILPYLVYPLCLGLLSTSVDNWGHLGGLMGGALMATFLGPEALSRFRRDNQIVRRLSVLALAASLVGIVGWGPHLVRVVEVEALGVTASRPQGWSEGWTVTDDRGWTSPTRNGTLVLSSKTYRRPLDPDEAATALLGQIKARATGGVIMSSDPIELEGWPGRRLRFSFSLNSVPQTMHAVIVTRGAYVHRLHLHGPTLQERRNGLLADKLLSELHLTEPPGLTAARTKALANPRSWKPVLNLAREAALAGLADEAATNYRRAYRLAEPAERDEVAAQALDFYADYGVGYRPGEILVIAEKHATFPEAAAAAAEALDRDDSPDDARRILDIAWAANPGDFLVRQAREARGM